MDQSIERRLKTQGLRTERKAILLSALFNPKYDIKGFSEIQAVDSLDELNPDSRPDLLIVSDNMFHLLQRASWTDQGRYVEFNPERRWKGYSNSGRLHYEALPREASLSHGLLDDCLIYQTNYDFFVLRDGKNIPITHVRLPEQEQPFLSLLQSVLRIPSALGYRGRS